MHQTRLSRLTFMYDGTRQKQSFGYHRYNTTEANDFRHTNYGKYDQSS
jgi:hypothetical protein